MLATMRAPPTRIDGGGDQLPRPAVLGPGRPLGRVLVGLYLVGLGAWAVARATGVSMTHDEALTFLIHVPGSWSEVLAHSRYIGSNNHLLNTLLIKLLLGILPPAEVVLRLPALLGLGLYATACLSLLRAWATGPRVVLGLIVLTANPFLIDMFTVARGYGLGLGLVAAAAAVAVRAARLRPSWRRAGLDATVPLLCAMSVLANLSFVFGMAALGALVMAAAARSVLSEREARRWVWLAGAVAIPWGVAAISLRLVYSRTVMGHIGYYLADWGGARGFWVDTVRSLVEASLYGAGGAWSATVGTVGLALVLGVGGVAGGWVLWRRREAVPLALTTAFVGLMWAAIAVAHTIAGMRWPLDRSAIMLIPGMLLVLVTAWELARRPGPPMAHSVAMAAGALVVLLAIVELAGANLTRTFLWPHDAATRGVVRSVAMLTGAVPKESVRLIVSWPLEPAVNFYRITHSVQGLAPVSRARPQPGGDLYYLIEADRAVVRELGLVVCQEHRRAGTLLAVPAGAPCPPGR